MLNKHKDTVFKNPQTKGAFTFNTDVVTVFDDMIERSVPNYWVIQDLIAALAVQSIHTNTPTILDLGCSTGTTIAHIHKQCNFEKPHYIGLDASEEMIEKAQKKHTQLPCEWVHNTLENYAAPACDLIILNLCLQFTDPSNRLHVMKKYHAALKTNGILLLIEKIQPETTNSTIFKEIYHQYKQHQGYSLDEIKNKDIALDGVLRPYSETDNLKLMTKAGFTKINTFFSWAQFHGWIAHK